MKVRVVTPWYPDYASIFLGVFVEQQVGAVRDLGIDVEVEVPQWYPCPLGKPAGPILDTLQAMAAADFDSVYPVDGVTTWIPAAVPARSGYIGRTRAFAAGIEAKRRARPSSADVTHAHLGVPTGAALLELGDDPLVVTEHQSTLALVLDEPDARSAYEETIERASSFFVVSPHLREQLIDEFGDHVGPKIGVMPNIVDLNDISFVERPAPAFRSWIYVGGLLPHKGVRLLLKSFVDYRMSYDAQATLTLVGDGPLREWIERFTAESGIESSVHLVGAVPHAELGTHLTAADVMVHLSPAETFGIATLEAIGAGLPVVSIQNGGSEHAWGEIETIAGRLLDVSSSPADVAASVDELRLEPSRLDPVKAREFVADRYAPGVIGDRLVKIYRNCVRP